jgi:hypothetical protein
MEIVGAYETPSEPYPFEMSPRILIITPKSPSTNPRMRKAADSLAAAGFEVKVLWAFGSLWGDAIDWEIIREADWGAEQIGGNPRNKKLLFFWSRLIRKANEVLGRFPQSKCRSSHMYIRKGIEWKPDLVIGHNPGALMPLVKIASVLQIPALFDAEDYHRRESYVVREMQEAATQALEDLYMPQLTAISTAAPLIAEAYRQHYPTVPVVCVNNAFSKKLQPPPPSAMEGPLRIAWFSQNIGFDRGLREFFDGLALVPELPVDISLIGECSEDCKNHVQSHVQSPLHKLLLLDPMPEKDLLRLLGEQEIGLALELGVPKNRDICRTNKLFTYPLAGCYMMVSETTSQRQFIVEFPETGFLVNLAKPSSIADALVWAHTNRHELYLKRKAAWTLANDRLHWEKESEVLVDLVRRTLS